MNLKYLLLIGALLIISASILLKEVLYSQASGSPNCTSLVDELSTKVTGNLKIATARPNPNECLLNASKNYQLISSCIDSNENQKTTIAMNQ
ncbi:hypothetical protein [Kangiella sp. HZ709]|uniref:hypothetical protein n=1 Tax=Kangiella sp. HZ709 TaxID=2666328 RepID=UPI0012AFE570|nr:hypothetical protein [Kangiella sp. HZ709]MRX27276.1 hypothetical protein [Kangiella sp. HZ709]